MRALVIQHERNERLGLIGEWAAHRCIELVPVVTARQPAPDPMRFDFVVVLGSAESVYDTSLPWIAAELELVRGAIAHDVPVLGVCFGAQLLARALGGRVTPLGTYELGWHEIHTSAPGFLPSGPWWEFHSDAFTVPPGATEIARTALCPQAFTYGPHLGVQFHPEITFEMHQAWGKARLDEIVALGLDPHALVRETAMNAERARPSVRHLLDTFTRVVHTGPESGAQPAPRRGLLTGTGS
ncbi:MAG: type 1 glutamine amidotransferase [Egibacteraceae bacterium]